MSCNTSGDEDFEEGLLESNYDSFIDNRQNCNPAALDYNTWRRDAGGLILSENHVLMEDDDHLRLAITQAMFLETASENLLKKRKRQIEMMDGFREEEGDVAKKLFDDVKGVLQNDLGVRYQAIEYNLTSAIAKSKLPLSAPDTTQPPPPMIPLPPMHVPPPSMSRVVPPPVPQSPKPMSAPLPSLMSQHLVPPPVAAKSNAIAAANWSEKVENVEHAEHEKHENVVPTRGAFRFPLGDQSTSWRTPYHPTPLPPPTPSPFLSCPNTRLPVPFKRLSLHIVDVSPPASVNPRRSFPTDRPHQQSARPSSPPGLVGVNVRGLFVGNRCGSAPLNNTYRRHSNNFKR